MKFKFFALTLGLSVILLYSCKKDEGEGGTSKITGKVIQEKWDNTFSLKINTYPLRSQDVFIIYGEGHNTYDNNYKTAFDGSYEFKFLQKGTYKLYVYTEDTTGLAATGTVDFSLPKIPIFATVEITKNNQTVNVPDMLTHTFK
ncbi:MAG: hypothetical protein ABI763_15750 [Bacteroidota bacterium]